MLFWNIFVFFLLPLLVLFLTRKLSVRGMILWTAGGAGGGSAAADGGLSGPAEPVLGDVLVGISVLQ